MKKLLFIISLFSSYTVLGQLTNTNPVQLTDESRVLELQADVSSNYQIQTYKFSSYGKIAASTQGGNFGSSGLFTYYPTTTITSSSPYYKLEMPGDYGGLGSPAYFIKATYFDGTSYFTPFQINKNAEMTLGTSSTPGSLSIIGTSSNPFALTVTGNSSFSGHASFQDRVAINTSGTAPFPTGYGLAVGGGIITEKVKVAIYGSTDWSDFVFAKDYKLKPLFEVEGFINEFHHLPGVPSAEQVVESGIDLAKMDATLLQKIEELTLYVIEQNKEIDALKKEKLESEEMKKQMEDMKLLIAALNKQLTKLVSEGQGQ